MQFDIIKKNIMQIIHKIKHKITDKKMIDEYTQIYDEPTEKK